MIEELEPVLETTEDGELISMDELQEVEMG